MQYFSATDRFNAMYKMTVLAVLMIAALSFWSCGDGAQRVDLSADINVYDAAYEKDRGPRVVLDGAHNNFHTATGLFVPLANLLRNDGFVVEQNTARLNDSTAFQTADIFVIANADYQADGS